MLTRECKKCEQSSSAVLIADLIRSVNPLRPNRYPSQTSHCNIKALKVISLWERNNPVYSNDFGQWGCLCLLRKNKLGTWKKHTDALETKPLKVISLWERNNPVYSNDFGQSECLCLLRKNKLGIWEKHTDALETKPLKVISLLERNNPVYSNDFGQSECLCLLRKNKLGIWEKHTDALETKPLKVISLLERNNPVYSNDFGGRMQSSNQSYYLWQEANANCLLGWEATHGRKNPGRAPTTFVDLLKGDACAVTSSELGSCVANRDDWSARRVTWLRPPWDEMR